MVTGSRLGSTSLKRGPPYDSKPGQQIGQDGSQMAVVVADKAIALSTKYVEYGDHVATAQDVGAEVTSTAH